MSQINIRVEGRGASIFNLPADAVCPRIGETITLDFTASPSDREQYNQDALERYDEINGKDWKVIAVEHHVIKWAWNRESTVTWVIVRPSR